MAKRRLLTIGLVVLAMAGHAVGWTLTTKDFRKETVTLRSLDDAAVIYVREGDDQPIRLPIDQFLSLSRDASPVALDQGALVLHLAGGGRLVGEPVRMEGDSIVWRTRAIGDVPASLRTARGITRGDQPLPPPPADAFAQDRIRLRNSDTLEGIVADVTDGQLMLQSGTDLLPVPLESIASVQFATAAQQAPQQQRGFELRLDDGSTVWSRLVQIEGDHVLADVAGQTRRMTVSRVLAIDQVNGPVVWLSDRIPDQIEQTPFIGDPVTTRFNTDLDGRPIRIADRLIAKAIAVHARSRLTWTLPEDYATFRCQYAIDGNRPLANVVVRIRLDDRIVHEQENVTIGPPRPVFEVDIRGAQKLTLEVDYGETYHVQDRLIWIEPALVR